jgi:mRNA interferase MazF
VSEPARGEVWWGDVADVGRRPFLVLTRDAAIPVLHSVVVAPLTKTVRGIPSELALGPDDGVPQECAATFDNLRVVPKYLLSARVCVLSEVRMVEACDALKAALDC